jgi:ribonucleoside-diphosphate reductase beta chain
MAENCSKAFNLCNLYSDKYHTDHTCFLDPEGGPSIQRFDVVRHASILKLNEQMLSLFWRPEEIDLSKDKGDFAKLPEFQQKIFTEVLLRAVLLDSVQGRAPFGILGPISSLPEVEASLLTQTFFENIHSQSYSHIIRAVYPNPDEIFDQMKDITEIVACARDISLYFDNVHRFNVIRDAFNLDVVDGLIYNEYEHKKAVYLLLVSINALEALRFHSAFAVFFAFAEAGYLQGVSKILMMIARDEQLHVSLTSQLLNILPKEDQDFAKIAEECYNEMVEIYKSVVDQEIEWVRYIFSHGVLLGLNEQILTDYCYYLARTRLHKFGIKSADIPYPSVKNPIPWMKNYLDTSTLQVAPQEVEQINYVQGQIDKADLDTFEFDL